jgi:hypothetical protein
MVHRKWLALPGVILIGLFAIVATAASAEEPVEAAPSIALAEESCPDGNVCAWPETGFQGPRGDSLCTGGTHGLNGQKLSVKNRCANKKAVLHWNGVSIVGCLNPGEQSASTLDFNEIEIGVEGSRC